MPGLVRRVADNADGESLATRARHKRFAELMRRFPTLAEMHVLDLGGTASFWRDAPMRPRRVTIVNLEGGDPSPEPWAEVVRGDACDLPAQVSKGSYDLTFSNSVIEHV